MRKFGAFSSSTNYPTHPLQFNSKNSPKKPAKVLKNKADRILNRTKIRYLMKFKHHTKLIIFLGFSFILAILAALTGIWLSHVNANSERLTTLVKEQRASELVFIMRDAAHKRALALYRLAILEDPFDLEDEYVHFMEQAEKFIKARDQLLAQGMNDKELKAWKVAQPLIRQGSASQRKTVEQIHDNKIEQAKQMLLYDVIPIQNKVMDHLTIMLDLQKQDVASELSEAAKENRSVFLLISFLGSVALLVGALIARFVMKTSGRSEQQLVLARDKAQSASQHKSLFLANMSHELRTPLNAIIGYSEMLQEEAVRLEESDFVSDLNKIQASGRHLLTLINDILDLSKIEADKMEIFPETFDLAILINEVISTIQPILEKNNNTLDVSMGNIRDKLHNDETKIRQTLLNLLSNACKFTEQGSIGLTASEYTQNNRPWIKIEIKDSGIGMTEKQIEKLFVPFTQADASTTRKYGGTGLGLTISKHFCNMMGGDLGVQSQLHNGSTFTITIPKRIGVTLQEELVA